MNLIKRFIRVFSIISPDNPYAWVESGLGRVDLHFVAAPRNGTWPVGLVRLSLVLHADQPQIWRVEVTINKKNKRRSRYIQGSLNRTGEKWEMKLKVIRFYGAWKFRNCYRVTIIFVIIWKIWVSLSKCSPKITPGFLTEVMIYIVWVSLTIRN